MEDVYDQEKVRKAITAIVDACEELEANLLEVFAACKAVMVSAEAEMLSNCNDVEAAKALLDRQ